MKKRIKIISVIIMIALMMQAVFAVVSYADDEETVPTRTIMFYVVGSNLEHEYGSASVNLIQILESDYNENLNFITMTGGTKEWQLPAEYLDGTEEIDPDYNQIYKMEGMKEDEEHGKMTLIEPTGIEGCEETLMNDPAMLTAFIDYCYENFPADTYSIILWDHGGGPAYGFGRDERGKDPMRFFNVYKAFKDCKLIQDGVQFDFINFDACLMGNTDIVAALSVFTDCIIASPETVPGNGEYYTGWLDFLCENPEITGYEIGVLIVEDFINYYEGDDDYKATYTVFDTRNFIQRLLGPLSELDSLLLAEAVTKSEKNGKYNYYDEIYSVISSYEYSKTGDYSLFDLGNFVGALSAPQSEFDNAELEDVEYLWNSYTELALEILEILYDWDLDGDDVLFGDWTSSTFMMTKASFVRDLNRELKDNDPYFKTFPTGVSIFESKGSTLEAVRYAQRTELLINELDDPELIEYFCGRIATSACYAAICLAGQTVSELAQTTDDVITYEDVTAALKEKTSKDNGTVYNDFMLLLTYLTDYGGVFEDIDETVAYISEIIDQQYDEAIVKGEVSVYRICDEDENVKKYGVDINGMSPQALLEVFIQQAAIPKNYDTETFRKLLAVIYGDDYSFEKLYPNGLIIYPCTTAANLLLYRYMDDLSIDMSELYQKVYASTASEWLVNGVKTKSVVICDGEGGVHITAPVYLDESMCSAIIPLSIMTADETFYGSYLSIEYDGEEWQILGLIWDSEDSVAERTYTPLDSPIFDNALFASAAQLTDSEYNHTTNIPISAYLSADINKENWGITLTEMENSEIDDIELKDVLLCLTDIYGVKAEFSEILTDADKAAEEGVWKYDIAEADVDMETPAATGGPLEPKPTVTYNGETLTEDVDYRIVYEKSITVGPTFMLIYGIGDYCGEFYLTYIISCGDHIIGEVLESVPPTCTENGHIQYVCDVCEMTVDEDLPARHSLIRTPAKQPTEDEDGNIEYWTCENCKKIFSDENGENEITLDDTILPAKGHGGDNPNTSDGAAVTAIVIMAVCAVSLAAAGRKLRKN